VAEARSPVLANEPQPLADGAYPKPAGQCRLCPSWSKREPSLIRRGLNSGHTPRAGPLRITGNSTAVAIALALSMGLKTGEKFLFKPTALLFGALGFAASVFLKLPLIAVLEILGPPAFLVAWRPHPRKKDAS
jgi:hypothetical protein